MACEQQWRHRIHRSSTALIFSKLFHYISSLSNLILFTIETFMLQVRCKIISQKIYLIGFSFILNHCIPVISFWKFTKSTTFIDHLPQSLLRKQTHKLILINPVLDSGQVNIISPSITKTNRGSLFSCLYWGFLKHRSTCISTVNKFLEAVWKI